MNKRFYRRFQQWFAPAAALIILNLLLATPFSVLAATETDTPTENPFRDVNSSQPYAGAILNLYKLNIMDGTGGGLFSPDQPLTRGQFAKLAVTAFKTPDYSG
ncbi:MAG: S-layer y domain, partial [Paenibacillus sp.]|nr:S-layer y domain [Paenibacillus sp.]